MGDLGAAFLAAVGSPLAGPTLVGQHASLQESEQRLRQELAPVLAPVLTQVLAPVPVKVLMFRRAAMVGTAGRRPARRMAAAAAEAEAEGSLALLEQEPRVGMLFASLAGLEKTSEAVSAHAAAAGG